MRIGWIDFSPKDRQITRKVLDLLSEPTALDELGIAPIRDGFSDLFFPGTSTIQTRAKYFLIVPYALKDLERESEEETNPSRLRRKLDAIERECGETLMRHDDDKDGIIGSRSLAGHRWVQRTPADIYWTGLRRYGIFKGSLALSEYLGVMGKRKAEKKSLKRLGNRNDDAEIGESDDHDAGAGLPDHFWSLPPYPEDWWKKLNVKLTAKEGKFLKERIIDSCSGSLLADILKKQVYGVCACRAFQNLEPWIERFPEHRQDYRLAKEFSDFLFVLRTVYNLIVSNDNNVDAVDWWKELQPKLAERAAVDLEEVFASARLNVSKNPKMCRFLRESQTLMRKGDLEGMKTAIKRREWDLKKGRAKTRAPEKFDDNIWIGGGELDYRFRNARAIIKDIATSEGKC